MTESDESIVTECAFEWEKLSFNLIHYVNVMYMSRCGWTHLDGASGALLQGQGHGVANEWGACGGVTT